MASLHAAALGMLACVLACSTARADLSISTKPTENMSCNAGVCTATAKKATLNVGELQDMLGTGDAKVRTGAFADNILVQDQLSWTSASRLTLDARHSVEFQAPVTVAGSGALNVIPNRGNGGELVFASSAKVDFWDLKGSLTINNVKYTLVGDVSMIATAINSKSSGAFALANDYDAAADGTYNRPPVRTVFSGKFEGLGHVIDHLKMQGHVIVGLQRPHERYTALFPYLEQGSSVRDLILDHVDVSSEAGNGVVGAIAGSNYGTIAHVTVSGSVSAHGDGVYVGGIVGRNHFVVASSVARNITVIGRPIGPAANHSFYSGGIAGGTYRQIQQSYADAHVVGGFSGGLAGYNFGGISNSYSVGKVSGAEAGGFLWKNDGVVVCSYSTGLVGGANVGGFVRLTGEDTVHLTSYWNRDTSRVRNPSKGCGDVPDCPGVTGLTDEELKSGLPEGFDPNIWGSDPNINNGYPYLRANPPE